MPWPRVPLDDVTVLKHPVALEGDWLHYSLKRETAPLGFELAIRDLPRLDVDDDEQVAEFIAAHGWLDTGADRLGGLDLTVTGPGIPSPGLMMAGATAAGLVREVVCPEAPRHGEGFFVHVGVAREVLRVARSLARHLVACRLGEDVAPAWADVLRRLPGETVPEEEHAWISFAGYLTRGLKTFAARVEFAALLPDGDEVHLDAPRADLFAGLCHQLFNAYVDEAPMTRCTNERCGKAFMRQAGRAKYSQYRTAGVIYCSRACARAQVERQRRRRLKGNPQ